MCESTIEHSSMAIPVTQPPSTNRRPRVREVSSRFMIPSSPSSSPLTHHHQQPPRSIFVQRRRRQLDLDPHQFDNEIETPLRSVKHHQTQHRRSKSSDSGNLRINTPNIGTSTSLRSKIGGLNSPKSAAAMLLRSSGMTSSFSSGTDETLNGDTCSIGSTSDSEISLFCYDSNNNKSNNNKSNNNNNSPMGIAIANKCKARRTLSEIRSSMPEAETRLLVQKDGINNEGSLKYWDSPCTRSLNLPLSNSSVFNSVKPSEKSGNFVKNGGGFYIPPRAKVGSEIMKKGKVSSHQEDVHSLRMLHNRYLQWRYVNAKAESSMCAQRRDAESTLYSLDVAMSEMRNSVIKKRLEFELLRKRKTLNIILEAQRPDLDEWASLEGDYSVALSETIQALMNSSLQLPTTGNVKADPREVGEALNSALKVMETIVSNVERFMPKAEEINNLMSELASVTCGETTLVEEWGELLSKVHMSQIEECSLRGQLMQLQRGSK